MKTLVVFLSIAFIYFLPLNYTLAQTTETVSPKNFNSLEMRLDHIESSVYSNSKIDVLINILGVLSTLILGMGAYLIYQGNKAKELAQKDFEKIHFLKNMVEQDSSIVTELTNVMIERSAKAIGFLQNSLDKAEHNTQIAEERSKQIKQYLEDSVKISADIERLQQTISAKAKLIDSGDNTRPETPYGERNAKVTGTETVAINNILERLMRERTRLSDYTNEK